MQILLIKIICQDASQTNLEKGIEQERSDHFCEEKGDKEEVAPAATNAKH